MSKEEGSLIKIQRSLENTMQTNHNEDPLPEVRYKAGDTTVGQTGINYIPPYLQAPLAPLFVCAIVENGWISEMPEGLLYLGLCALYSYIMTFVTCLVVHLLHGKRKFTIPSFTVLSGLGGIVWSLVLSALDGRLPDFGSVFLLLLLGLSAGFVFSFSCAQQEYDVEARRNLPKTSG